MTTPPGVDNNRETAGWRKLFKNASPDARLTATTALTGAVIAAMIAAAAGLVVGFTSRPASGASNTPPVIQLDDVRWLGNDGRYEVLGHVTGSTPGQLVWTYNQDARGGPLFPDHGPCPIDPDGAFHCSLGYAGSLPASAGVPYNIYAAVVTPQQAYDAEVVATRYEGRDPYGDPEAVPRIAGERSITQVTKVHPS